jgi:6-phosphogluconate dehydrogenase
MAVKVTSGDLIHKVIFKQPTSSLNEQFEKEITYTDAITTRAAVLRFNQYRTTEANATLLMGARDFYIRHSIERESIDKRWLIHYRGKDWVIHEIEPIEEKEMFIRFTAKAKE